MTQTDTNILKDEHVELAVERKPECVVEFDVKASAELVKKAHGKAVRKVAKEVSLPGFRKGKAPEALIVSKYGDSVDQHWQKAIADSAFQACEKLAQIPVVSTKAPITFNMEKHDLNDGAELKFTFESEPIVPEIDLSQVKLKDVPKETVEQDTVDEGIRQVAFFFAEWTPAEDRGAEMNDFLILDVYTLEGEEPQKVFNDTRFEFTEKSMAEWMRELIAGMKVGEEKEGQSRPDADATEEEKKEYEPRKVRLVVKKIETAKLPEIDDAFAAKVGCKTVDEMTANIRSLFENKNNEKREHELRQSLCEELLEKFPFDLPKTMLDEEVKFRMKHMLQNPSFKQDWDSKSEDEQKAYLADVREQANKAVRMFYLCRKVAQEANLELNPQEAQPKEASFLELLLGMRSPHEPPPSQEDQSIAMSRLMLRKAENYLIEQLEKNT